MLPAEIRRNSHLAEPGFRQSEYSSLPLESLIKAVSFSGKELDILREISHLNKRVRSENGH